MSMPPSLLLLFLLLAVLAFPSSCVFSSTQQSYPSFLSPSKKLRFITIRGGQSLPTPNLPSNPSIPTPPQTPLLNPSYLPFHTHLLSSYPSPNRLLRLVPPRIPSIARTPDFTLRVRSATAEDAEVAGVLIDVLGEVIRGVSSERGSGGWGVDYSRRFVKIMGNASPVPVESTDEVDKVDSVTPTAVSPIQQFQKSSSHYYSPLINDRRFEQLIECIVCQLETESLLSHNHTLPPPLLSAAPATAPSPPRNDDSDDHDDGESTLDVNDSPSVQDQNEYENESENENLHPINPTFTLHSTLHTSHSLSTLGFSLQPTQKLYSLYPPSQILKALAQRCLRFLTDDNLVKEITGRDLSLVIWSFSCVSALTGLSFNNLIVKSCQLLSANKGELSRNLNAKEVTNILWGLAICVSYSEGCGVLRSERDVISCIDTLKKGVGRRMRDDVLRIEDVEMKSSRASNFSSTAEPASHPHPSHSFAFPPRDLTSLLWSLTTLFRPSSTLLDLTLHQLSLQSQTSSTSSTSPLAFLSGADLTNLVVSIAKTPNYYSRARGFEKQSELQFVLNEITLWSLVRLGYLSASSLPNFNSGDPAIQSQIDSFEPKDLSSLMWGLSLLSSKPLSSPSPTSPTTLTATQKILSNPLPHLAQASLQVSSTNLENYTLADLVCLLWSYSKVGNIGLASDVSDSYRTIGRIYEIVERQIGEWVGSRAKLGVGNVAKYPLEPSLLCKLASSTAALSLSLQANSPLSSTTLVDITKLTSRLLVEDNELLKGLGLRDLARLCWSCSVSTSTSAGSSVLSEYFKYSRALTDHLNLSISNSTNASLLDSLPASDLSTLILSLSMLGIGSGEEGLRCKIDLDMEQIEKNLSVSGRVNLLTGLVKMGCIEGDSHSELVIDLMDSLNSSSLDSFDLKRLCLTLSALRLGISSKSNATETFNATSLVLSSKLKTLTASLISKTITLLPKMSASDIRSTLQAFLSNVDSTKGGVSLNTNSTMPALEAETFNEREGAIPVSTLVNSVSDEANKRLAVFTGTNLGDNDSVSGLGKSALDKLLSLDGNTTDVLKSVKRSLKDVSSRLDRFGIVENLLGEEEDKASFELGRVIEMCENWNGGGMIEGKEKEKKNGGQGRGRRIILSRLFQG